MATEDEIVEALQDLMRGVPVSFPKDGWHMKEFTRTANSLKDTAVAVVEATTEIESKFRLCNLGDKAALLIMLRNIKVGAGELQKLINKLEPHLEQDMCLAISEQGLNTFQTETHTLTAKADAFISHIPQAGDENYEDFINDPEVKALEITQVPLKAIERLCRERLESGEDLPPGCTVFIKASIGIRRRPR